jgi:hypothetical protein
MTRGLRTIAPFVSRANASAKVKEDKHAKEEKKATPSKKKKGGKIDKSLISGPVSGLATGDSLSSRTS